MLDGFYPGLFFGLTIAAGAWLFAGLLNDAYQAWRRTR